MENANPEETILALARSELDRWSAGDTVGYAQTAADDVTYFDNLGAQARGRGRVDRGDGGPGADGRLGGQGLGDLLDRGAALGLHTVDHHQVLLGGLVAQAHVAREDVAAGGAGRGLGRGLR